MPTAAPGRGGEALGDHLQVAAGELRVEHLVEVVGVDPLHRLLAGELDVAVLGHVDGHPQGRRAGALADAGLEHPELALLDRELGVAHVAVVQLEPVEDVEQLGVDRGELQLQVVEVLGVADAGHHVLALGVDQEVAVRACSRRWPRCG